jgi:hypothetical protein
MLYDTKREIKSGSVLEDELIQSARSSTANRQRVGSQSPHLRRQPDARSQSDESLRTGRALPGQELRRRARVPHRLKNESVRSPPVAPSSSLEVYRHNMVNKDGPVLDIPTRTSKQIGINEKGPVLEIQPLTSEDRRRLTGEAILHVVTLPILGVAVWAGLTGARLKEEDANVAIATRVSNGPGTVITVRDPKDPHTVVCIGRG